MINLSEAAPWSNVADGYADWSTEHLRHYAAEAIRLLEPPPSASVLDVGCGAGAATVPLADAVREVTGVDFAPAMLAALGKVVQAQALANVTLLEGDGQDLPLEDNSFDFALSMFGLMFFPDRARGFSELRRCVRPSGRVAVSCWVPGAASPAMAWMTEGFAAAFPEIPIPPPPPEALDSAEKMRTELEAAGFVEVKIHELSHDMVVEDVHSFWPRMVAGSAPFGVMRGQFSDEDWSRRHAAAVDALRARTERPAAFAMPAILGVGTVPQAAR